MLARRIAVLAALLLFTAVLTSSFSTRREVDERAVAPAPQAVAEPAEEVTGELPADRTVRARVGEVVSVDVRPEIADRVVIDELGVSAEASPQVPGTLEFVASAAGRYPVTLFSTGERIGTVVVEGSP